MPEAPSDLDRRHLWHRFTSQSDWDAEEPLVIELAEGTELIDSEGRRYIDGGSSLWCSVHGHRHPRIDRAVRKQLERFSQPAMLGQTVPGADSLAEQLVALAPPGLTRVLYSTSGSAANAAAVRIALRYWQRRGGQHRRRTSLVNVSSGSNDVANGTSVSEAAPLHGGRSSLRPRSHRVEAGDAEGLERLLEMRQEEVAAVIVEPLVETAAGVSVHPPGFLRRVRELCTRHEALLICDEATTGFGRTGTMFACEQERVSPDLMCVGAGLTGGYLPLAATLASERVYEGFSGGRGAGGKHPHEHVSAGNPLACAAGLASLEAFRKEGTLVRLQPKIRLLGELLERVARMPEVAEVRGRGFVAGIDLGEHDRQVRLGPRVAIEARRRGVIVSAAGDVVVLIPPLTIGKADLRRLVETVGEAIAEAHRSAYGDEAAVEPMPERVRAVAGSRGRRAAQRAA